MRIRFILPCASKYPIGGFRVVYEYANFLVQKGHEVSILHPIGIKAGSLRKEITFLKHFLYRSLFKTSRSVSWFKLDPRVKLLTAHSLKGAPEFEAEVVIATAWRTANYVANLPPSSGKKFYLIQGYEIWDGSEMEIIQTWKLPLNKIVISKWLWNIANEMGETAALIPFGLNQDEFGIDQLPINRQISVVGMLYHCLGVKGTEDGLRALYYVKEQKPELQVRLFGVFSPPELPSWISYDQLPSRKRLRELYNECQIFLAPSHSEGLSFTPLESMLCGAALVATNIGGHLEYAFDRKTALLAPPKNPIALSECIIQLLNQPELRLKLASEGEKLVAEFTLESAGLKLEQLLLKSITNNGL